MQHIKHNSTGTIFTDMKHLHIYTAIILIGGIAMGAAACNLYYLTQQLKPAAQPNKITGREYQFDVDKEGYYIYDGQKYLGFVPYTGSNVLDSIINKDNE